VEVGGGESATMPLWILRELLYLEVRMEALHAKNRSALSLKIVDRQERESQKEGGKAPSIQRTSLPTTQPVIEEINSR
jgi:hypothetical protein